MMLDTFHNVTEEYVLMQFYHGYDAEGTLNKHKMAEKLHTVIYSECFANFKSLASADENKDSIPESTESA